MASIILQIDAKPLSTNKRLIMARYGGRFIKSNDARTFEFDVKQQLLKQITKLNYFNGIYDKKKHAISTRFYFYCPQEKFFTKSDTVSSKCFDTSNAVKTIEDCVFSMLGIDDSQNIEIYAKRIAYNQPDFKCFIEISTLMIPNSIVTQSIFNQF